MKKPPLNRWSSVRLLVLLQLGIFLFAGTSFAQEANRSSANESPWVAENFKGLEMRSIGPAFMSGRIADIAIDQQDENTWYIGVGSGGVWKTTNSGVTFEPIFDDESTYSIGCVTVDPSHSETVWVGTGENVGGRHLSFGDGVYRSSDGGKSWQNMGLPQSEHISKIIVHPNDPNTVWVAAQGPLWKMGGQRGLYKTVNGGKTWKHVLGDEEHWTGVTDLVIDPRNPDRLYAATWDRHRTVAAYMGGGPGSGLHRSSDGGETWQELTTGLPKSNMGKIGLAISSQNPDTLYAAIELDRRSGGVFKSIDRGQTWKKQSSTVSGGTGPHYYQELYACPHHHDRLYLMDVRMQVSDDGGKTFRTVSEKYKHSDNHALAFRSSDPNYLLSGCDGGLYESFDLAKNWRFFKNLPLTQFYKIALDDSKPFYNIYGGTQDNSTEGGPSRTDNAHGIQNSDWRVVLDWDGHQPATEPGNPNIVYAERQEGFLSRIDMSTGEVIDIQPQPGPDEDYERFNWDAPILVSPHNPTRIYFASQRVWRSENRGDEWTPISEDLTRNQNRLEMPILGKNQSWDSAWDVSAMSNYNTITSLSESPLHEGLLYAGTDDGLISVSENGGDSWNKLEVSELPGVPETAFVNDIRADLFDANTVYVALDNHKYGDLNPYLLKSSDRGKTWTSMKSNLPSPLLVWRVVQDHVQPKLMFLATEFGIYFTVNGGEKWTRLEGGVPTISFRDIHIHRRENDLVGASFGRGIYVFDDIEVFRQLSDKVMSEEATLFSGRDALWYFPRAHLGFEGGKGDQGADHFVADNPPFGAVMTYYLRDGLKTQKEIRQESEKERSENRLPIEFPGWDKVESEQRQMIPKIWIAIKDESGNVIRRLEGPREEGFHRVAWDLRFPTPDAITLVQGPPPMWGGPPKGLMCAPGQYTATLYKQVGSETTQLSEPQSFSVKPIREGAIKGIEPQAVASFWREYEAVVRIHSAMQIGLANALVKIERLGKVIENSQAEIGTLDAQWGEVRQTLFDLDKRLNGDRAKLEVGEKNNPIIGDRLFAVSRGVDRSTYGPTPTHRKMLELAKEEVESLRGDIDAAQSKLSELVGQLIEAGGPWIESEPLPNFDR